MTFLNTKIDHEITPDLQEWMKEETAEQEVRYQKIYDEMDALKKDREVWYEQFFNRIMVKGFNEDGDIRRKIKPEDIPVKPEGRNDLVIWKYGELTIEEVEGK